jgi:hypothetical protein
MARHLSDPVGIDSERLLLCEGKATLLVLGPLLRHFEILGFQLFDFGGTSNLKRFLSALRKLPRFDTLVRTVAIVRDAEQSASQALAQVQNALRTNQLPVPEVAGTSGIAKGFLSAGVFLLPDNERPGMLETLCMDSVDADPASQCVEQFFDCVKRRVEFPPRNIHKARAQAFLASREIVDYQVGWAADNGVWNFNHPCFAPLAEFLRAMAE